jgi:NAD(P)-dependent dehydrogenase (short-subunit alcohol dehydrogenase family)
MERSFVVTGGASGVGRAIAERLAQDGHVVVLDRDPVAWIEGRPSLSSVTGDAADEEVATRAAESAARVAPLAGWVNNAAIFRDAALHDTRADEVLALVSANLALALTGCSVAVRQFLAAGTTGAIVNVSSHQAQRPVRGALPYATAKAAIEGLTRAAAVDYGPAGIRVNAVALGSIETERSQSLDPAELAALHPLGRAGRADEVAELVAVLLGPASSFVSGAVIPVDGGRAVLGPDPEARDVLRPS